VLLLSRCAVLLVVLLRCCPAVRYPVVLCGVTAMADPQDAVSRELTPTYAEIGWTLDAALALLTPELSPSDLLPCCAVCSLADPQPARTGLTPEIARSGLPVLAAATLWLTPYSVVIIHGAVSLPD
jgi:hypothetical protein